MNEQAVPVVGDHPQAEGPITGNVLTTLGFSGGISWPVMGEFWVVPRGDLLFVIGASTAQDEKSGSRKEVRGIIDTIKID
jgi:hypothetical protein